MQLLWFELSGLSLLLCLLIWRCVRRMKLSAQREKALPPGHGFDATPVQERLNHLRQDYGAMAALRPRRTPAHELIVMAVRRSLVKLSYFHAVSASHTTTNAPSPGDSGVQTPE